MDPFVVVIYGPVGVGKSSTVAALARANAAYACVAEPLTAIVESGALADVAANNSSSGLRMQMLVMAERNASYWALASRLAIAPSPPWRRPIVVCDGHISLDPRIFNDEHVRNGRMSRSDLEFYNASFVMQMAATPAFIRRPDLYIYLRGSADECCARAKRRACAEEKALDVDFFARMVHACDSVSRYIDDTSSTFDAAVTIDVDGRSIDDVVTLVNDNIVDYYHRAKETAALCI